ncbi:TIGR03643 family protein [Flavobacteriales bacterium]|nr:TIGR03643 family protein [Flavobacteriales bacterium]
MVLSEKDIDRIIEMAWEDRTPFDAIELQFNLKENQVRHLMRKHMKRSSFEMWRKRVKSRKTKHLSLRSFVKGRFKSSNQK